MKEKDGVCDESHLTRGTKVLRFAGQAGQAFKESKVDNKDDKTTRL